MLRPSQFPQRPLVFSAQSLWVVGVLLSYVCALHASPLARASSLLDRHLDRLLDIDAIEEALARSTCARLPRFCFMVLLDRLFYVASLN